jgi:hypothetical protein
MFTKIIIIFIMLIIVSALGYGLFNLVRDQGKSKITVKALTIRIVLSVSLFIFLFFAFKFQWIAPHDL